MNWDAMGAIGEVVGAIAVVATLIYLALQIRQNTKATRTATHQTQVDSQIGINTSIATDDKLADLIARANDGYDELKAGEQIQLLHLYVNFFNLWHSAYWNNKEQFLSEHAWPIWDTGMAGLFSAQIACRTVWARVAPIYDTEFQQHVNGIVDRLGPIPDRSSAMPASWEINNA
ncbi:MAG: hypothetical protein ACU84Q_14490 [Gammaproteobacteria bacterium]